MFIAFIIISLLLLCTTECSPQELLLATNQGVDIFSVDTSTTTIIQNHEATAIHFRYSKRDLYYIMGNLIFYSYYSQNYQSYANPIIIVTSSNPLTDLVVDWQNFRLYYSDYSGTLYKVPLRVTSTDTLYQTNGRLQDLAIDPYDRILFFIEDGMLVKLYLDTLHTYQYKFLSHPLSKVVKVAVNPRSREVFVVGSDANKQWHLVGSGYNDTSSRLLFNGTDLEGVFALDVYDNEVTWGRYCGGKYEVRTCKLTPDCDINNLNVVLMSDKAINDVKFFNPLVQTPTTEYACLQLNCSHQCVPVAATHTVQCTCPQGMSVDYDGNQCRDTPPPLDVNTPWAEVGAEWLVILFKTLYHWFTSSTAVAKTVVLVCCALMLVLAVWGLCLLQVIRKGRPKSSAESYHLRTINSWAHQR